MSKRHPQYDYDQIKGGASCLAIAREIGLNVDRNGRCAATWRGGDNPTAVSIKLSFFNRFSFFSPIIPTLSQIYPNQPRNASELRNPGQIQPFSS